MAPGPKGGALQLHWTEGPHEGLDPAAGEMLAKVTWNIGGLPAKVYLADRQQVPAGPPQGSVRGRLLSRPV